MADFRTRAIEKTLEALRAAEYALQVGASEFDKSMAYAKVVEERRIFERRLNEAYATRNSKLIESAARRQALMAARKKEKMERMMSRANAGSKSNMP